MNKNTSTKKRGPNALIPNDKEALELALKVLEYYSEDKNYDDKNCFGHRKYSHANEWYHKVHPAKLAEIALSIIKGEPIHYYDVVEIKTNDKENWPLLKELFSKYDIRFSAEDKKRIKELSDFGYNMDYLKPYL
jgi:hypothetical protein